MAGGALVSLGIGGAQAGWLCRFGLVRDEGVMSGNDGDATPLGLGNCLGWVPR
jgi:hypothetical protein